MGIISGLIRDTFTGIIIGIITGLKNRYNYR